MLMVDGYYDISYAFWDTHTNPTQSGWYLVTMENDTGQRYVAPLYRIEYPYGNFTWDMSNRYIHADADVAKYQKRYESLTYQYENDFYNNDNDVGKYELVSQIEYWNTDLAYRKTIQRDFWLGIYYPNIYDQFEFIKLDKEVK